MKRLIALLLSMTFALYCGAVSADREIGDRVLPDRRYADPDGMTVKAGKTLRAREDLICFTAPEYKTLGLMIVDYRWFWDYTLTLQSELRLERQKSDNLALQVMTWNRATATSESGRVKMTELFEADHKALTRARKADRFEMNLWRGGTVVGLAAAVVFAVMWGIEK